MSRKELQKQAATKILDVFTQATRTMSIKGAWTYATLNHSPAAIGIARNRLDKTTQGEIA